MPITQDRMIALINAGRDYKQAYEATRAAIETHWKAANNSEETWAEALNAVWQHTKPSIVLHSINSNAVLEVEHHHFKAFRAKNKNAAARANRKRRDMLVGLMSKPEAEPTQRLPQTTAPKSAIRPEQPAEPIAARGFIQSTDEDQVQADTELEISEDTKSSVGAFLDGLEEHNG